MLAETRAISPIQNRAVQVTPTRARDRFPRFKHKGRYQRIHRQAMTSAFSDINSFDKEEPMYDGQSRTILFNLGHLGSNIDLYV
ncbi:MAG: hypothetical protein OMM_09428 [Candidatus Magnetoglobus multicellularis str. Araruama]|uniref:Uncharacterized protein n=1 Tax=Candidatus Magnetoglobus multicellularis str. Araruama TaxID=890399 RepID=A0A1V1P4I4_9BACT|nr:MAG: hypothetical protein OMM_09428 [Candidatus Magnetoglobus multicellularis str. Araruama]